jgi:transposase InsO family protein
LDRCLRRYKVGNLRALQPAAPQAPAKTFKAYEPGYVHVDIKYLPQIAGESARSYLFVAIDRATRWVFVQIRPDKSADSARAFLAALHEACPIRIVKILTDNGKEFTDRLFASREREPSGQHEFDQLCQAFGIEHRLTKPRTPQTNGMVERLRAHQRRAQDAPFSFRAGHATNAGTLCASIQPTLPQSALHRKTPSQTMNDWYLQKTELFHRKPPPNHPGCDNRFF